MLGRMAHEVSEQQESLGDERKAEILWNIMVRYLTIAYWGPLFFERWLMRFAF
jgi:hypothetical protein